ncbi:MAG: hypothetical protein NUV46_01570 [Nanoarchaeota archaeon]|nr:hypothetical protein [Nanoarchaeota archaeon]
MPVHSIHYKIADSAKISSSAHIEAKELNIGKDAIIEDDVSLIGEKIFIGDGTRIRKGTHTVSSDKVKLNELNIGDFSDIWENCKIYVPKLIIGDYAILQDGVRMQGHLPLQIGHNFWVGSEAILNSSGGLNIGNNVGIGARSEIYSHGYHGELLEGCKINTVAPVNIGDDTWLTGSVYVSPGVNIGNKSIVLFQSNVTKDIPPNVLARGNPAKVVDNFVPYSNPSLPEKINLMSQFLKEFYEGLKQQGYLLQTKEESSDIPDILNSEDYSFRVILEETSKPREFKNSLDTLLINGDSSGKIDFGTGISHFSLLDKHYTKNKTLAEILFMKHMVPLKARFTPYEAK